MIGLTIFIDERSDNYSLIIVIINLLITIIYYKMIQNLISNFVIIKNII